MKLTTHSDCLGVRGIMTFKCLRCGEESNNYMNGVKICRRCCEETKTCQICGEKIEDFRMKTIKLTASEIRSIEHFLYSNPCTSGCCYPEMQKSNKDCDECKLTKDRYTIMEKLGFYD